MSAESLELIGDLAVASTAAVCAAWGVTLVFQKLSAAWRHVVWLLALLAPVVAGMVVLLDVEVSVPVLPAVVADEFVVREAVVADVPAAPPPVETFRTVELPQAAAAEEKWEMPWMWIWAIPAVGWICAVGVSHARVLALLRRTRKATAEMEVSLEGARHAMGWSGVAMLRVSEEARVPFCYGYLKRVIVFPSAGLGWSEERRQAALRHEIAHLMRWDLAGFLLAQMSCAMCWFNPLAWFAAARLKKEAEMAADDMVIVRSNKPEGYAAELLSISEEMRGQRLPVAAMPMARPGKLTARLGNILNEGVMRSAPKGRVSVVLLVAVGAVVAGTLSVRLVAAEKSNDAGNEAFETTVKEAKDAVAKAIDRFHELYNKGDYAAIYDEAGEELWAKEPRKKFADSLKDRIIFFGTIGESKLTSLRFQVLEGSQVVTATMDTIFNLKSGNSESPAKNLLSETFKFTIRGEKAKLEEYSVRRDYQSSNRSEEPPLDIDALLKTGLAEVDGEIAKFHSLFNEGDYSTIYNNAGDFIASQTPKMAFIDSLKDLKEKAGDAGESILFDRDFLAQGNEVYLRLKAKTHFEKGTGREKFTIVVKDGEAKVGYHAVELDELPKPGEPVAPSAISISTAQKPDPNAPAENAAAKIDSSTPTTEEVASFLGIRSWKTKAMLPVGEFNVAIHAIANGKMAEQLLEYPTTARMDNVRSSTDLQVMMAPMAKGMKFSISVEGNGTLSTVNSQIEELSSSYASSLPAEVKAGDYVLIGQVENFQGDLTKPEAYKRGFLLRIEKK